MSWLRGIISRMLKILRLWRLTRLVKKENELIGYKDPFLVEFYSEDTFRYVNTNTINKNFRIYTRDKAKKQYIIDRTIKSAIEKKYLTLHTESPFSKLEVNPDKGEDFVTVWGLIIALFRELNLFEQIIATVITSGTLIGIYNLLLALIDKI